MKITLDALDGRNLTLRLPRDGGREHVLTLFDTRRLRGVLETSPEKIALDPVEADDVLAELSLSMESGSLHLAGPLHLHTTTLDLDLARGGRKPGVTGEARSAGVVAPSVRLLRGGVDLTAAAEGTVVHARHDRDADRWDVTADTLEARSLTLALAAARVTAAALRARAVEAFTERGSVGAALAEASAEGLSVTFGGSTVTVDTAALRTLRLARGADGGASVEAASVALTGVTYDDGKRRLSAPSVKLTGLRYGADGLALDALEAGELTVALEGLAGPRERAGEPAEERRPGVGSTLGRDLPFLDHLAGKIDAAVVVDVKLPVVKRRVATHRLCLDVTDGALDFKVLEHGLSHLEDAILDFEVDAGGLYLELDAVVVKRELLRWPLDAEGLQRARQRRVRLRTLAQPKLMVRRSEKDPDAERRVALHRVDLRVDNLEGALLGASTLELGGGTLRLGADGVPALGQLQVRGTLVHDLTQAVADTELTVALSALELGLEGVQAGRAALSIQRLSLGQVTDAAVTFAGLRPSAVKATLRELALRGVRRGRSTPAEA
ncbi:MAG: hypothetical protein HY909_19120 [Deltaproteobacteria bacterium]|nr:hypothetical protein [Deltaproteobacteria bacterium]